jgi:hypothetical protein
MAAPETAFPVAPECRHRPAHEPERAVIWGTPVVRRNKRRIPTIDLWR